VNYPASSQTDNLIVYVTITDKNHSPVLSLCVAYLDIAVIKIFGFTGIKMNSLKGSQISVTFNSNMTIFIPPFITHIVI
jgi:hypothetical protein